MRLYFLLFYFDMQDGVDQFINKQLRTFQEDWSNTRHMGFFMENSLVNGNFQEKQDTTWCTIVPACYTFVLKRKATHEALDYMDFSKKLHSDFWINVEVRTALMGKRTLDKTVEKQCTKLEKLMKKQRPTPSKLKTYVIILSGVKLDKDVTNLLQKGLNFSLSPRSIPMKI